METLFFVGGCSGSSAPEENRAVFGNLTTSFGVTYAKKAFFIDNGSGVPKTASFLLSRKAEEVWGLQTHSHADHRAGIQNNRLLFRKEAPRAFFAPKFEGRSFQSIVESDFADHTWPIRPSMLEITDFTPGEDIGVDGEVHTLLQNHPGGCVAYRITTPAGDVVISTDSEPTGEYAEKLAEFISGSALCYLDVQYRDGEYEGTLPICGAPAMSRKGWGHGTPQMIFNVLSRCKEPPAQILIGHHDPARTTGDLFVFESEVKQELIAFPSKVRFAKEGDVIEF